MANPLLTGKSPVEQGIEVFCPLWPSGPPKSNGLPSYLTPTNIDFLKETVGVNGFGHFGPSGLTGCDRQL